jgi:hypothetical protein
MSLGLFKKSQLSRLTPCLRRSCRLFRLHDGPASLNAQHCVPLCIGRIAHHAPVVVGCAIAPPWRPALAQAALGCIDSLPGKPFGILVFAAQCFTQFPVRSHQVCYQLGAIFFGQTGISHAPEPAAHHEVAAVRRDGVGQARKGRRHAPGIAWADAGLPAAPAGCRFTSMACRAVLLSYDGLLRHDLKNFE